MSRINPESWRSDWMLLRVLGEEVRRAADRLKATARGQRLRLLDFGAGEAPYETLFEKSSFDYQRADLEISSPGANDILVVPEEPLALADEAVDVVVSFQVLEHVWELDWYLKECLRVLKPDGVLVLSTHGNWPYHPHPGDYRRWTSSGLRRELECRGFDVESMRALIGPLGYSTILRSTGYQFFLRRFGWLGLVFARLIGWTMNARVIIEEKLTPESIRRDNATVLFVTARPRKTSGRGG